MGRDLPGHIQRRNQTAGVSYPSTRNVERGAMIRDALAAAKREGI